MKVYICLCVTFCQLTSLKELKIKIIIDGTEQKEKIM